ncbi:head-tail connector protein [Paracoccus sulfuroxidans]|uniref:Putative phage protein (Predicted DNA packaging) n=1 Tax=Paracoccus sulfuroxidans TaxID=384678 RepID=A0A562P171_9RHOB|nr:head-tail connector protein [Paracoccus sulfuroxidans]TWI38232.1 putative phage protein (predicted DNA packaging) [Paracoccus sulfuroxidans]
MITLENIKTHLRIDGTEEDAYVLTLLAAAVEYIEKTTGIPHDPGYPDTLRHAALLLIGNWYQNREGVSDKPLSKVPLAFDMLIHINRPAEGLI